MATNRVKEFLSKLDKPPPKTDTDDESRKIDTTDQSSWPTLAKLRDNTKDNYLPIMIVGGTIPALVASIDWRDATMEQIEAVAEQLDHCANIMRSLREDDVN